MSEPTLTINLALESEKVISVPYTPSTTAEDVCIHICKKLNIGTLARHLFALRITGKTIFLMPNVTFGNLKLTNFDFRIRFKVAHISKLKKYDIHAYNYYFHQARTDVMENKIPGLVYEKFRSQLLGLGITDMYRVMLEKGISREVVESEYKKFVPRDVLKKHAFFIKRPIHENLVQLEKTAKKTPMEASFVKAQYINQLDLIAPEYLSETYKAMMDVDGLTASITVKISPPHVSESGIKYCLDNKKDQWISMCTIEELGFISIREDAIEMSRRNGIPINLKFHSVHVMWSFITVLDGYYRLTCKWTFNLCQDLETPSLRKLQNIKCHGPVGGEFSYAKLEAKTGNKCGSFIIRESETSYSTYYIDVCVKDSSKPKTFKLDKIQEDEFIFHDDINKYQSIQEIIQKYRDPEGAIYLKECVPPSEYDISPLLLCRSETVVGDALTDSSSLPQLLPSGPVCINYKDLQVYKGQKKEGLRQLTHVYRGMWKVTRGKKIEVALKFLNQDAQEHIKDYLHLGQWSFLKSSAIVRLFGIAISMNDISLVMEYFKLGPLDQYLKKNRGIIKKVDLIEAASNLAAAVWHLNENDLVHGRIRCRKLMVSCHEENAFNVKLADPGIHTSYDPSEVHWIPVEYMYVNTDKRSTAADVWAMATTIYEMCIYTYGKEMPQGDYLKARSWYHSGNRLPRPPGCMKEIYSLMLECWHQDPHKRKLPQEISRDVNQLLYQVFNSRKQHAYDVVGKSSSRSLSNVAGEELLENSTMSLNSNITDSTDVEELISIFDPEVSSTRSGSSLSSQQWPLNFSSENLINFDSEIENSKDLSEIFTNMPFSVATSDCDGLFSMQSIFELNYNCNVVLDGKIGQGFYGDVYRGILEDSSSDDSIPKTVAVKKLKAGSEYILTDFEREITIMKKLKHRNIVEILGVLREPDVLLVMEFVQHGSLQSYLKINKDKLHDSQLLKYASDIAVGMDYLGKMNIVHRDLAARNILVVDENSVKISDFGLAQFMGPNDYYMLKSTHRLLPIKWYAPESLKEGKFSVKSDVWSYGVTLYEMFIYGEDPPTLGNFDKVPEGQEQQVLLDAIEKGERFPMPTHCPSLVYASLMRPCWEADPHKRPTFLALSQTIYKLLEDGIVQ